MAVPESREPSLYDAKARIARASEHIKSLEREIERYGWRGPMSPFVQTASVGFNPSPLCSILVGETAYNLKAALDYLVSESYYLATGNFNNGTKFLIVASQKEWERNFPQPDTPPKALKKLWLHRLSAEHQAVLKGLQPFSGTDWTKTLQKITNPDRHKALIELAGEIGYTKIERLSPERAAVMPIEFPAETFVHFETSRELRLHGIGAHAIQTLQHLTGEVAKVIEAFEPYFQREAAKTSPGADPTDGLS